MSRELMLPWVRPRAEVQAPEGLVLKFKFGPFSNGPKLSGEPGPVRELPDGKGGLYVDCSCVERQGAYESFHNGRR